MLRSVHYNMSIGIEWRFPAYQIPRWMEALFFHLQSLSLSLSVYLSVCFSFCRSVYRFMTVSSFLSVCLTFAYYISRKYVTWCPLNCVQWYWVMLPCVSDSTLDGGSFLSFTISLSFSFCLSVCLSLFLLVCLSICQSLSLFRLLYL